MRCFLAFMVLLAVISPAAAQDMPLTMVLLPGEKWQPVSGELRRIRSLASGANGDVFAAANDGETILRIDRDGRAHDFARPSSAVMGLAFAPDGRLYACQRSKDRIIALDGAGKESILVSGVPACYLAVTRQGRIYATAAAEDALYRIEPSGEKHRLGERIPSVLGATLWLDQGTLVAGDREGLHLTAFRIDKDGGLSARERYYTLRQRPGREEGVSSMTVDIGGRLYAATAEGVQVFDPTGRMCGVLLRPRRAAITALAFGGADMDRLYIVCGGKLYVRKTKTKGVAPAAGKAP